METEKVSLERVLCAAIWYPEEKTAVHAPRNITGGVVLCGFRHGDIISQFSVLTDRRTHITPHTQGFLTSENRFVNREEAAIIAMKAGQLENTGACRGGKLYSEDLY
jgi:hypothetical protein